MHTWARFAAVVALLTATGLFLHARGRYEVIPSRPPLAQFPHQLGPWTSTDIPIDKGSLDVLGPGDFLLRVYEKPDSREPIADLFIAYFPTQRAGDTMHSPQNCLPGAGWRPLSNARITLSVPGVPPFLANQYVIAKGSERELVLYWYLAHNRAVASEYWAKIYLVLDAMRTNRSDGSLIRMTTPILPGESTDSAQRRLQPFAEQVVPKLNAYIPE